MDEDQKFLEDAINDVKSMLLKKRDIWTSGQGAFNNFEIHDGFDVDPIQFALVMCNLKLNRLKSCWDRQTTPHNGHIALDKDAEDSMIDLASYAILGLALMRKERDKSED